MSNSMLEKGWAPFRAYLKELLHDAMVRKLIEERTNIAPRTLARWGSGETEEPDRKRLASLLQALPQYQEPLLAVITKAIPDFTASLLNNSNSLVEDLPEDFWIRLAETNANAPKNLHFIGIINLMFLQLQASIDPERIGVQLNIATCTPPASPAHPVRSLREIVKMKTHPSLLHISGEHIFLGAESLAGYSVGLCQANVIQNVQDEQHLPFRRIRDLNSVATYPIQRGGYVAGCFLVVSPQPDFFSPHLQYLLQIYAYLLSMAFESDQFYAPEQIHLRLMPATPIQLPVLAKFQDRVIALLQRNPSLSRSQAETTAWQQIEEDLLAHVSDLQEIRSITHADPD